ncbi:helix-turn-helix domain-containing protein [Actinokineospora auranticolor]|uniref:DNA-binding HxlR family transcriptional regulator n=1 Tax=Actinokineospora auranticolor TaxID=155976 RepID=A0A2S6GEY6_9PSEU|nr:helix-turn-helix domain-containing protein [Actinokineospora auranticolor]PPK63794.1 DNA-binding HxlR family transcriptional regulator [Actinokineospora auranticolor]
MNPQRIGRCLGRDERTPRRRHRAGTLLGERWTLAILRELFRGRTSSAQLVGCFPYLSKAVVRKRLRALLQAGVVERSRSRDQYRLTASGEELRPLVEGLGAWGRRWLPRPTSAQVEVTALIHEIAQGAPGNDIDVPLWIDIVDAGEHRHWSIGPERGKAFAHKGEPRADTGVRLTTTVTALVGVWLGHTTMRAALREHTMVVRGRPEHVRGLVSLLHRGREH